MSRMLPPSKSQLSLTTPLKYFIGIEYKFMLCLMKDFYQPGTDDSYNEFQKSKFAFTCKLIREYDHSELGC